MNSGASVKWWFNMQNVFDRYRVYQNHPLMISIAKPIEKYASLSSSFKRSWMTEKSAILRWRTLSGVSRKVTRLWNSIFVSLTLRKDSPDPPHSSPLCLPEPPQGWPELPWKSELPWKGKLLYQPMSICPDDVTTMTSEAPLCFLGNTQNWKHSFCV